MTSANSPIVESVKEMPVFTVGGKEFLDRIGAEEYLASMRLDHTYFVVRAGYDTTECRGYFAREIVAVPPGFGQGPVIAHCLAKHGPPVAEVYGTPVEMWLIDKGRRFTELSDRDAWVHDASEPERGYRFGGLIYVDGYGEEQPS